MKQISPRLQFFHRLSFPHAFKHLTAKYKNQRYAHSRWKVFSFGLNESALFQTHVPLRLSEQWSTVARALLKS